MKLYVICLILLTAMVALCILGIAFLTDTVDRTCAAIQTADSLYRSGDHTGAASLLEQAEALWKQRETPLDAILSHEDLDRVMTSFAALRTHALCGDPDDYYGQAASLLVQLEQIRETEQPALKNIF